jgi:hypothetical protein
MKQDFEKRLKLIEERNLRVEQDKAWETSIVRRLLIAATTYLLVGVYLIWLKVESPWLNAIVPVLGFTLSTLALQSVKSIWLKNRQE